MRPGDLTAREALCTHDAELKNELGHMIRSNNQLQLKLNVPKEEKDECMKNSQVLEEKLEKIKDLKHDEIEISTNISDVEGSADETVADVASRIQSHENELAKALEENDMSMQTVWIDRCETQRRKAKELRDKDTHFSLQQNLKNHIWPEVEEASKED
ncbi:hypothetical protein Tco_0902852 [Tanacetum coccineum]